MSATGSRTSRGRQRFRHTLHRDSDNHSEAVSGSPNLQSSSRNDRLQKPCFLPENWRQWPELNVRLYGMPFDISARIILDSFQKYGDIDYINIYDPGNQPNTMSVRISFRPPPHTPFWTDTPYMFDHPDKITHPTSIPIRVVPDSKCPDGWFNANGSCSRSYPTCTSLQSQDLELGSTTGQHSMTVVHQLSSEGPHPIKVDFDARHKRVVVLFPLQVGGATHGFGWRLFKMVIHISNIRQINFITDKVGRETFVLQSSVPPEYSWQRKEDIVIPHNAQQWSEHESWFRATSIADNMDYAMDQPLSVSDQLTSEGHVDIGRWRAFRLVLKGGQSQALSQMLEALKDHNIKPEKLDSFAFEDRCLRSNRKAEVWKCLDQPPASAGNHMHMLLLHDVIHLPFEVRYQLEVCISRGFLPEHNVDREFLEELAKMKPAEAQQRLEYLADQENVIFDPLKSIRSIEREELPSARHMPDYCYLSRKAVVTPATMYLNTPAFETSNRVMRKYSHEIDRFLKVQFVEEGGTGKLRAAHSLHNDEVWKRVWRTLNQGIQIGDRKYEFLAFGNSQLRECCVYFFSPTPHLTCDDIRAWAGDFDHIKIVAKWAARLGQCFSTTRTLRSIPTPRIKAIPDLENGGECFSDGCSKISRFLAQCIHAEMPQDDGGLPSAFQFRMGGCKGVLAISEDAKAQEVHIRPSQEKFKAQFNGLEIIRCARFATATLNRQTITLLSSLRVPDHVFHRLLETQLQKYQAFVTSNAVAIELLTKFVDHNRTSLIAAELIRSGFRSSKVQDPFVLNILNLWRSWSLKLLKEKARIHVEQSAFVLGCVDETGTLRGHTNATEGSKLKDVEKLPQIFLQVTNPLTNQLRVIEAICIVGRNPSLHPGDIRVVQAVDNPRLYHLKDVVVFPSIGDKAVPSMLSGGDLDGDDFFVIWEPDLIPQVWNTAPMDFSTAKPNELERAVDQRDLKRFFVDYMMNDMLGPIAFAHLAYADKFDPGSETCVNLAKLHSQAVDYPKTGQKAAYDIKDSPKDWPHFMGKPGSKSYRSHKVLGRLYDKVTQKDATFRPDWDHAFDERVLKRFKLDPDVLKRARQIKTQHDRAVRRVLAQLNLGTEFELWSGFAMSKPVVGSDYKRAEQIGEESRTLQQRFREICYEAAGGTKREAIDPFVAAMYKVTEEEVKIALFEHHRGATNEAGSIIPPRPLLAKSMPLITFPWLFPEIMARVAQGDAWEEKKPWYAPGKRKPLAEQVAADALMNDEISVAPSIGPE